MVNSYNQICKDLIYVLKLLIYFDTYEIQSGGAGAALGAAAKMAPGAAGAVAAAAPAPPGGAPAAATSPEPASVCALAAMLKLGSCSTEYS